MSDTEDHLDTAPTADTPPGDDLREVIAGAYRAEVERAEAAERDERGRFAPKNTEAKAPEATDDTQAAPQEEPEPDLPEAWSAVKDHLASVPREVRRHIAAREAELAREIEARETRLKSADPLLSVMEPYRHSIAAMGLTEQEAVLRLLRTQEAFEADPVATLHQLARSRGIDLRSLAQSPPAGGFPPQDQFRDPRVDTLLAEREQQSRMAAENQQREIASQIDAFAKDPAHVHFAKVREDMGALLQAGRAATMAEAYERAIWAHPEVRQVLIREQSQAQEAERRAAAAKAAEEARRKSVSIRPMSAPNGTAHAIVPDDRREAIRQAYAQIVGNA